MLRLHFPMASPSQLMSTAGILRHAQSWQKLDNCDGQLKLQEHPHPWLTHIPKDLDKLSLELYRFYLIYLPSPSYPLILPSFTQNQTYTII